MVCKVENERVSKACVIRSRLRSISCGSVIFVCSRSADCLFKRQVATAKTCFPPYALVSFDLGLFCFHNMSFGPVGGGKLDFEFQYRSLWAFIGSFFFMQKSPLQKPLNETFLFYSYIYNLNVFTEWFVDYTTFSPHTSSLVSALDMPILIKMYILRSCVYLKKIFFLYFF